MKIPDFVGYPASYEYRYGKERTMNQCDYIWDYNEIELEQLNDKYLAKKVYGDNQA